MLAYAADQPRVGARRSSPNALIFIVSAHVVAIALIISANVTTTPRVVNRMPPVISVPLPKPPPPRPIQPTHKVQPKSALPQPRTETPPLIESQESVTAVPDTGPFVGNGTSEMPALPPLPQTTPVPVSTPAQPMTSAADLRPPYPPSKLAAGEEASLTLRLTIDENGRVIAVDPVGRADPVFLAAARKHLMAHWRYKPAMQGGRPVSSTAVVTLQFELDN
jgi:protein TonB